MPTAPSRPAGPPRGEPTLHVVPTDQPRQGGRNQELILAAVQRLWDEDITRLALLSGGIWPGPRSNFHESDVVTDGSHASAINGPMGFSSRHPEGLLFLMCDGAVRTVQPEIDSQPEWGTLQKLAARDDGQPVGEF